MTSRVYRTLYAKAYTADQSGFHARKGVNIGNCTGDTVFSGGDYDTVLYLRERNEVINSITGNIPIAAAAKECNRQVNNSRKQTRYTLELDAREIPLCWRASIRGTNNHRPWMHGATGGETRDRGAQLVAQDFRYTFPPDESGVRAVSITQLRNT